MLKERHRHENEPLVHTNTVLSLQETTVCLAELQTVRPTFHFHPITNKLTKYTDFNINVSPLEFSCPDRCTYAPRWAYETRNKAALLGSACMYICESSPLDRLQARSASTSGLHGKATNSRA